MNVLVTGGAGMVGSALKRVLSTAHYPTRQEMDLLQSLDFSKIEKKPIKRLKVKKRKRNNEERAID